MVREFFHPEPGNSKNNEKPEENIIPGDIHSMIFNKGENNRREEPEIGPQAAESEEKIPKPEPTPEESSEGARPIVFGFDEKGKAFRKGTEGDFETPYAGIKDAKFEEINFENTEESKEVKRVLNEAPEAEKEKLGIGIHTVGFAVQEKKNDLYVKAYDWLSKTSGNKSMEKFFAAEAKIFRRESKKAHKRIEEINEDKSKKTWQNSISLGGNILRYGRTAADIIGVTAGSPLRYAMMGSMAFSRGAEGLKEVRLENEELIDKTRIQDADKAAEEAWRIYEEVSKNAGGKLTAEELNHAYREQLPQDLLNRLEKKPEDKPALMNHIVQKVFQKNIESSMKNLSKKVEKIDGNKKLTAAGKEKAREILFRRYEHRLNDYDRMLTQYGTVDTLAMGARYLELGGKAAVAGMTVQTLFLSGEKLYEYLSHASFGQLYENISHLLTSSHPTEVVAAGGHGAGFFQPDVTGHGAHGTIMDTTRAHAPSPMEIHETASGGSVKELPHNIPHNIGERPEIPETTVHPEVDIKSSGIIAATHKMVEQGTISEKDLQAALANPESSTLINGKMVSLRDVDLVPKGASVRFVESAGGKAPRLELILGGKGKAGTAEDLQNAIRTGLISPIHSPENELVVWGTKGGFLYKSPDGEWSKQGYKTMEEALSARQIAFRAVENHPLENIQTGSKSEDLPPDFLNHKPQIPEVEAGSKSNIPFEPPHGPKPTPERIHEIDEIRKQHLNLGRNSVEHPVEPMKPFAKDSVEQMQPFPGKNIAENILPEKIVFRGEFEKGLDGHLTLGYDVNHEPLPVNYNEVVYSGPVEQTDFTGFNRSELLNRFAEMGKSGKYDLKDITEDKLNFDLRDLKKMMAIYNEISKNQAYEKHASLVAKNIATALKNIGKSYGDIIDPKKLPEVFRKFLK